MARLTIPKTHSRSLEPLKCLVQVKATNTRNGYISIKLSNWKHLTEVPLPAFFVIMEFDGKSEPQQAYAVHLGYSQIRRVKKRLRELSAEGKTELHKCWMRVTYDSRHKLDSSSGEALRRALLDPIKESPSAYARKKLEMLESVGYEKGGVDVRAILNIPEAYRDNPEEYLVDFAIGLIPEIEAREITTWDVRFGIRAPEPEDKGPGTIQLINDASEKVGLIFSTTDGARRVRLDGELFFPGGLASLISKKNRKVRLASPYVDFLIGLRDSPQLGYRFHLPDSREEHPLRDLKPVSDLLVLMHETRDSGQSIKVSIDSEPASGTLFELHASEEDKQVPEGLLRMARAIRWA